MGIAVDMNLQPPALISRYGTYRNGSGSLVQVDHVVLGVRCIQGIGRNGCGNVGLRKLKAWQFNHSEFKARDLHILQDCETPVCPVGMHAISANRKIRKGVYIGPGIGQGHRIGKAGQEKIHHRGNIV